MGSLTCPAVSTLRLLFGLLDVLFGAQTPADLSSPLSITSGETFDFIIVGGGTAGCILANRLSEVKHWRVLLLEAGGEEPFSADIPAFGNNLKLSDLDYQYWTQPQNTSCGGKPCQWPRGKVLGGGSTINDMIYNRGNRHDYDKWEELGNTGWGFEEGVLPYFKKGENNLDDDVAKNSKYHGVGGYQSVQRFPYTDNNVPRLIEGFTELNFKLIDINGAKDFGVTHLQATQENGERRSTNRAYLGPIRGMRRNLVVATNTRVTKVLINSTDNTAYGVKYVGEKNRTIKGTVYASKEVILSAGAINSPQILMLSGIGPKEILEKLKIQLLKDSKVGYNLQDHVGAYSVSYLVNNSTRPDTESLHRDAQSYLKRRGPWSGIGSLSVVAYVNSRYANKSIDYPDIQYSTIPSFSVSKEKGFCDANFTIPWCYYNRISFMSAVLRPESRGQVSINSTDPFAPPLIYPNYFTKEKDMDVLVDGIRTALKLGNTTAFKKSGFVLDKTPPKKCSKLVFDSDDYWKCVAKENTHSNYHPVGTCKMGPASDKDAVVDPNLRVYGARNLRVIDASIMPLIPSGNTNAPTIMVAERGADLVKESHGIKI